MRKLTVGTHNTHDGDGRGPAFADVVLYTEVVPVVLANDVSATHDLWVCKWQRDLAIALDKSLPITKVREHYRPVHPGVAKVTPHRGTYWLTFELDGRRGAALVEHRINAAFPPYRRGEATFRRLSWQLHTRVTLRIVRRLIRKGRFVLAGGDPNTTRKVRAYRGVLEERGHGFDRIGVHGWHVSGYGNLSRSGSDHHRLKVWLNR